MSSPDTTFNPILTSSPISDMKAHVPPPASNIHPNTPKTSSHNCTNSKSSSHSGYDNIPTKGKNWRAMIVNVNGLRSKVPQLNTVVNYVKPDVIVGCESKILAVGFPTRFLPKPKNRVTRSFFKTEKPVFGCL